MSFLTFLNSYFVKLLCCISNYTAKFTNPKKDFILAGGADKNQAKVFNSTDGKPISVFNGFHKPCLVADSSSDGSLVLLGASDGSI